MVCGTPALLLVQEFKIQALQGIVRLFPRTANCFYAGFGNRDTDMLAYTAVGVPTGRIFIINPKVRRCRRVATS